jgi:class 3 adenylate cyclase
MNKKPSYKLKSAAPDKYWLQKTAFDNFGPDFLNLDQLLRQNTTFEGLAVILDLKDFTGFCDQRDPHHEVPKFLDKFVKWFFRALGTELLDHYDRDDAVVWSHLPIFGKFLGDGVLLLWEATDLSKEARRNLVQAFDVICNDYERVFLRKVKAEFTRPPSKLRCGIAQGQVTSIAGGKDYVGLCINIASRLQKLADDTFSFGFTKKGLEETEGSDWYHDFRLIKIPIRGVAKEELIYVLKREFRSLSKKDRRKYRL